jgi:uncharacterized membrane protein
MEICILKFNDTHDADRALDEVLDAEGNRQPWLHEVGVVKRPLLGRISIRATFGDDEKPKKEVKQGDLASRARATDVGAMTGYMIGSLVGPLHADMAALEGANRASYAAQAIEDKLMFVDEIKQMLPRGSSALVLVASEDTNDEFVELFSEYNPELIRRDVAEEVEKRLHTLENKVRASQQQVSP